MLDRFVIGIQIAKISPAVFVNEFALGAECIRSLDNAINVLSIVGVFIGGCRNKVWHPTRLFYPVWIERDQRFRQQFRLHARTAELQTYRVSLLLATLQFKP